MVSSIRIYSTVFGRLQKSSMPNLYKKDYIEFLFLPTLFLNLGFIKYSFFF